MRKKHVPARSHEREQFWQRVISGQTRSGMTVASWCQRHNVSAPSFYVWRQRLAGRRREAVVDDEERNLRRSPLLPMEIIPAAADEDRAALEIELPNQVRVRVQSGCKLELLRQVLTILQQERREAEGC